VPPMALDLAEAIARRLKIGRERVTSALDLLEAGLSPVFIAHYRKVATGSLDEETILAIRDARDELTHLEDLRRQARSLAESRNALTDDLAKAIDGASDPDTLEDLVRPIRPRRRTAGQVARERGLNPLAEYIRHAPADGPELETKAAEFVDPAREVRSAAEALVGAAHILAERVAEAPAVRDAVRRFVWKHGTLLSRAAGPHAKRHAEYRVYFNFSEPLSRIPPHRILAINRGQRSKILRVTVTVPLEDLVTHILSLADGTEHRFAGFLRRVVADALSRLVLPAVDRQIRRRLTERAERHAIEVFVANLRSLLMTKPVRGRRVLAIQPGYRTGCKTTVLDADGRLLADTILYPLEPQKKWDEAARALAAQIAEHGVETIAIGNGTGCREVEALVSETIEAHDPSEVRTRSGDVLYAVVSEAGAAAYADSEPAREEFARLEPAIRAAVSIGRRLQDPLDELVKIDPRAIGVGLYQHDVDQGRLQRALDDVLASCVAAVGADANTASAAMLRRVPGLGDEQVEALLARRAQTPIESRDDLKTLPGWDEKTFLQAAGFLRVYGPNPLDATRVHPDRYADAERLLAHLGYRVQDLASSEAAPAIREALRNLAAEPLARELDMPLPRLEDLVEALKHPGRDPRSSHPGPVFRRRMSRIEDLVPGQWVKGTVRNVVDFGAFVDIGLKEEGLIHVSEFSRRYVRNPLKFLHVGDIVRARIVNVDVAKHRISLSLVPGKGEKGWPKPAHEKRSESSSANRPGGRAAKTARAGRDESPRPAVKPERRSSEPRAPRGGPGRDRGRRGRPGRPGGRGREPRHDGRRRRSGPPRVTVSRPQEGPSRRDPDRMGRPKIRWAYYDSDSPDDHPGTEYLDEFEEYEEIRPRQEGAEPGREPGEPDQAPQQPEEEAAEVPTDEAVEPPPAGENDHPPETDDAPEALA